MPRWDKEREYVICDAPRGAGSCGGRIGRRIVQDDGSDAFGILPGWERAGGSWHEPPHDIDRRGRGYGARPLPTKISQKHRDRGDSYFTPMFQDFVVTVRCSDCMTVHELSAQDLGVVPIPAGSVVTVGVHP